MRLRHIEVFHAVYTTGTVSNAAKRLNVSQPSISKVLHHAEDQLGYPLFERVKGKLIPTNEAHALFGEVHKVYRQMRTLQAKSRNLRGGKSGHVRIAVMPALGLNILPLTIANFRRQYPEVTFDVQTRHYDDLVKSLNEHEDDIGLAFNPPQTEGIQEYDFGSGEFVCICNEGDFGKEGRKIRLEELEGKDVIGIKDSGPLAEILYSSLVDRGIDLESVVTVQTYYIAKNIVGYGGGVAIVDQVTALSEGPGNIEIRELDPPIRYSVKGLYLENSPLSAACRNFLEFFKLTYENYIS